MFDLSTGTVNHSIRILVSLEGGVFRFGKAHLKLLETIGLLNVEQGVFSHDEEVVIDFFTVLADSLAVNWFSQDHMCSFSTFANMGAVLLDLVVGPPPFALEVLAKGRDLQDQLIDAPVGIARAQARV